MSVTRQELEDEATKLYSELCTDKKRELFERVIQAMPTDLLHSLARASDRAIKPKCCHDAGICEHDEEAS